MKISGFMKLRNEVLREGNVYRALENIGKVCDGGILCDDASTDGTREVLRHFVDTHPNWELLEVEPHEQDFAREMHVKQQMMDRMHHAWTTKPDWVWWLDGDEIVERPENFRAWVELTSGVHEDVRRRDAPGFRFHYTQLWRNTSWARTDGGFDEGVFCKLWRYREDLSFDTTSGTHKSQFPVQIDYAACPVAPFEVIHYGNVGKNLVWKAIQYAKGRGGVDRHIHFGHPPGTSMATGEGWDEAKWAESAPTYRPVADAEGNFTVRISSSHGIEEGPRPFTLDEIRLIRSMSDLRDLKDWFTVIVPAYNRAPTLPKALDSLLAQTHKQWVAVVLDDGSTDETAAVMREYQDRDPRIFYARYLANRGGVAMNEIGMALACEMTEYWTRLGSDDWFGPGKLARDAACLATSDACFGPYTVTRCGRLEEVCNQRKDPGVPNRMLRSGEFVASWANCAVRTSALRKVREKFGDFCDRNEHEITDGYGRKVRHRIRNMEDFLVNARIATVAEWVWRDNHGELDAAWNDCTTGASGNGALSALDDITTRQLIGQTCRP